MSDSSNSPRFFSPPSSPSISFSVPNFESTISINHYELSAASFARFTIPESNLAAIVDIVDNDYRALQNLLFIDHLNRTIRDLETQVDLQKKAAARLFHDFISRPSTTVIPSFIHKKISPNCRTCRVQERRPTPYARRRFSMDDPSSSSTSPMPFHPHDRPAFRPRLRTTSTFAARRSYMQANPSVFEERPRLGTSENPIIIEDSDSDNDGEDLSRKEYYRVD